MIRDLEYDPLTCVTAREVRLMGFSLPNEIPDCAWIHRHSMVPIPASTEASQDGDTFHFSTKFRFTEPFQWISVKWTIEV